MEFWVAIDKGLDVNQNYTVISAKHLFLLVTCFIDLDLFTYFANCIITIYIKYKILEFIH